MLKLSSEERGRTSDMTQGGTSSRIIIRVTWFHHAEIYQDSPPSRNQSRVRHCSAVRVSSVGPCVNFVILCLVCSMLDQNLMYMTLFPLISQYLFTCNYGSEILYEILYFPRYPIWIWGLPSPRIADWTSTDVLNMADQLCYPRTQWSFGPEQTHRHSSAELHVILSFFKRNHI